MSGPSLSDSILAQFYGKPKKHLQPKVKRNAEEFARMWLAGEPAKVLSERFNIQKGQIGEWRRLLNLPARMPGNYTREDQVAYMNLQLNSTKENSMRSIRDIFRSHAVFDNQGRHINGTDKQSNHNYGDAYEEIFTYPETERHLKRTSRNDVKLMMEIGVADGSSLLAWREVFPNATIVGMDIHPAARIRNDFDRIQFFAGDQRSHCDCVRAASDRQFDVIVEDATHRLENTLLTFLFLWPFVRPGGLYIVEEWDDVGSLKKNITQMWPNATIVDTKGPFGGNEPLVVFRK